MRLFRSSANSLTRRFTLALASLGAMALLLVALASWWLVSREHADAVELLVQKELDYNAKIVGSNLQAISSRLADVVRMHTADWTECTRPDRDLSIASASARSAGLAGPGCFGAGARW